MAFYGGTLVMNWFNNLSIKWKIQIAFFSVSLLIVSAFGYFSYSSNVKREMSVVDSTLHVAAEYYPNLIDDSFLDEVMKSDPSTDNSKLARIMSMRLTDFTKTVDATALYSFFIDKDGQLKFLTSSLTDAEVNDGSTTYNRVAYDEPKTVNTIKRVLASGKPEVLEYESSYGAFRTLYVGKTTKMGEKYVIAVDMDMDDIIAAKYTILKEIGIMVLVSLVSVFLVSLVLGNIISKPILQLVKTFEQLGSGNGDLTYQMEVRYKDETGQMARNFNLFINTLKIMVDSIKSDANELKNGLSDINQSMGKLLDDAQKQSDRASTSAATIEEITATMGNISNSTETTTMSVNNVNTLTKTSSESVKLLSREVGDITVSANELSDVIHELETKSLDIAKIVNVIRGIADQTNLLALNASIEAARAGEHGRGFAVVAEEVRNLAGKTSDATVSISNTINAISSEIEKATQKMDQTNNNVASGVKLANNVLVEIADIQANMGEVFENVQVINLATKEQSIAAQDMARSAEQLSESSVQSQSIIKDTEGTVAKLEQLSIKLNDVVAQFKTE